MSKRRIVRCPECDFLHMCPGDGCHQELVSSREDRLSRLESAVFGAGDRVRRRDVVEGLDKLLTAARRSRDPRDLVGMAWALKRRFEKGVREGESEEPRP